MSPIDRWNGRGGRLSRKHLRRRRNRSRHRGRLLSLLGGSSRGHGGLGGRGMITGRRSRPLSRRTGLGRGTTVGGTWGSCSGRRPTGGCRGSIASRLTGRLWPDGVLLGRFDRPRRFRRTARRGGCAVTPSAATPWTIRSQRICGRRGGTRRASRRISSSARVHGHDDVGHCWGGSRHGRRRRSTAGAIGGGGM